MRVRSIAKHRRSRHASASQRALLLDLPGNEQLSPAAARAISSGSVYKWRVFVYRSMKKACTSQYFYDLDTALNYIRLEQNEQPLRRVYLEALDP